VNIEEEINPSHGAEILRGVVRSANWGI
jgi:hypothetical protein